MIPLPRLLPARPAAGVLAQAARRMLPLLLLAAGVGPASAATPRWSLEAGPAWWFRAQVRVAATPAEDPPPTAGADRLYDDGYNRRDASGNVGDGPGGVLASRTGYFGYSFPAQLDQAADTLTLHRVQAAGTYLPPERLDAVAAPHLALRWRGGDPPAGRFGWGLQLAFSSARFTHTTDGVLPASLRVLADAYRLGGVVPQAAPFAGRFTPSPGDQRIGDTPTRTLTFAPGTVDGRRAFSSRLHLYQAGLTVTLLRAPADTRGWDLSAQGGLVLAQFDASFEVHETLRRVTGGATSTVHATGTARGTRWGWFAGFRAAYAVNDAWSVAGRAEFVSVPEFGVTAGPRRTTLDLSRAAQLTGALSVRW